MTVRGRPSKYDPAMCERIIELGKTGASQCEMAAELGIHWTTFEDWRDNRPDFSEAVKQSVKLSQAWWEKNGRIATFGGCEGFNATSYIFQMKNRFADDWRDKQEREMSGTTTTVIQVANEKDKKAIEDL